MDNIQETISQIMADPKALDQVQSLGKMLGISQPKSEPTVAENSEIPVEMMTKLTRLMPLFRQANQEDDTTRLLVALKPFLSQEKRRKLDSAKKMLQMMKLIPLLKEGGIIDLDSF